MLRPLLAATAIATFGQAFVASPLRAQESAGTAKSSPNAARVPADWNAVDAAMGRSGSAQPGGVHKYGMPRSDLDVSVDGVGIRPSLALGSWVAFERTDQGAMMMGDLVLAEGEIEPVMSNLQASGVEQTALHNHLLRESPRVMYMHIAGHGDPVQLARAVHDALALTGTPAAAPTGAPATEIGRLDTQGIEEILGRHGKVAGGVFQVSVPRAEIIHDMGVAIPPAMGVATSLNFEPTGDGKAAIAGDFVLTANEVNPVIATLRAHGIEVTAVHNHMLTEEPRLFFLHVWANDDALELARGLRTAIDQTNAQR